MKYLKYGLAGAVLGFVLIPLDSLLGIGHSFWALVGFCAVVGFIFQLLIIRKSAESKTGKIICYWIFFAIALAASLIFFVMHAFSGGLPGAFF
jgi:hypothetical protein